MSLSLAIDDVVLLFFLGGRTGMELPDLSLFKLEVTDIQVVTPFLFLGFLSLAFIWATSDLYSVAAITMASSEV